MRKLALDNDTLNGLQEGDIDLEGAGKLNADYYVPVTQRHEFVYSFDKLKFEKQDNICEVLIGLDLSPLQIVTSPYGALPYGRGPYGGGDPKHYQELMGLMGNIENHRWDVIGAEAAIVNNMEFVTNDLDLISALEEYSPGNLLKYSDFKEIVNSKV